MHRELPTSAGETPKPTRARRPMAFAARVMACVAALTVGEMTTLPLAAATSDAASRSNFSLEQLGPTRTIKLQADVGHVQGVDLDASFIYITSVNKKTHRGTLHKFTLAGEMVGVLDVTDGARYHPGGIALDGDFLWVPVAETKPDSTAKILQIDKTTLKVVSSFTVDDHIGAIGVRDQRLYGATWGAKSFYLWDRNGKELANPVNPTRISYQDIKFVGGDLVASGLTADKQAGAIDWLDPDTFEPRQRLPVGKMNGSGTVWTQEGMTLKGNSLYLLPADGHNGSVDLYVFNLENMNVAALECLPGKAGRCTTGRRTVASREKSDQE